MLLSVTNALGDESSVLKVASVHFYNKATKAISQLPYSELQLNEHYYSEIVIQATNYDKF